MTHAEVRLQGFNEASVRGNTRRRYRYPSSTPALQQPLQEELAKRGLDTKWDPLKGKKTLVDRLQVGLGVRLACKLGMGNQQC